MMSRGWDPARGEWSIKTPLYQTSTFVFESAAAAQRLFEIVYGGAPLAEGEEPGWIYTRLAHPNLDVVESRLAVWDGAERALLFSSGTSAILTILLTLARPGQVVVHSEPVYGGTNTLLRKVLAPMGYRMVGFTSGEEHRLPELVGDAEVAVVHVETPANPTNDIFDIAACAGFARDRGAVTVVDNTFLTPIGQRPLDHGADLVVYSATKYLGGHSDLIAGAVTGPAGMIAALETMRYRIGTTADPHTAWLLGRSLETLSLRVARQTENAGRVALHLAGHSKISSITYLGLLPDDDPRAELYRRQCLGPGAMINLEIAGGRQAAFRFLDSMRLIALTTSLGGTESIACHPVTTTHSNVDPETRARFGITEGMIRLSIGVEAAEDLIADIDLALEAV